MSAATKYKIEILASAPDCWRWRITSARNGQIIVTSETYLTKQAATKTVTAFVKNMTEQTPDKLPITYLDERG